jgi:hypothetical protein
MASLILTFLPAVLTFAVATWSNAPSHEIQPRSAATNCTSATPCER